ncbi:MAG: phosphate-starvation-inducible PsiE family protein [Proteobacteria bacterium]|nr:phosphate-starvation-inducible PsiE family protein [Pseudomonadota bacterium]
MDKLMHRATTNAFLYVENTVYGALGALLATAALLALGAAGRHLWDAVAAWNTGSAVFSVIERLLLVFMLVEILHTIRASMQSHTLTCEPFLIVALIASVRRMLVITLESSEASRETTWTAQTEMIFRSTMLELGVLGTLSLIMVVAIYMLRRSRRYAGDVAV